MTHSIFISAYAGDLPENTGMTWNDEALESVHEFLTSLATQKNL